ncbi:MAG: amino acid ABC transporter permease [Candidatus Limnocylindrales bacterium]
MSASLGPGAAPAPEEVRPPTTEVGVIGWLSHNLFSSKLNGLLTIVTALFVAAIVYGLGSWMIFDARWGVITENMRLFLVGRYPPEEIWRVWLAMVLLSAATGLSAGSSTSGAVRMLAMMLIVGQLLMAGLIFISDLGLAAAGALVLGAAVVWVFMLAARRFPVRRLWISLVWLGAAVAMVLLLAGLGAAGLASVSSNLWGGLLLTMVLSIAGILLSFPLGVALAVGRQSRLPVVRVVSIAYIEIIRAVPLISILFMAQFLFPLVLPDGLRIDNVIRAIGGITLFSAAYVAENVRGGLQAIPRGQHEAAFAIGLRTWQTTVFIVLPQALRITIPANVGLFISLLKDTTLAYIIGLLELLGIGRAVLANPEWLGTQFEVYGFIAVVFFVLSYTLSQASYRLEKELGIGER